MHSPEDPRHTAALHLLGHQELTDRACPFLAPHSIDWAELWRTPPWSSREERVLRAAADLWGPGAPPEMAPLRLAELAATELWDPGPYSRRGEDHSHRVLEALGIRRGLSESQAQLWLARRYDTMMRVVDVWEWGALPTGVDPPTHILTSRRLAAKTDHHLHLPAWRHRFESLAAESWSPDELLLIEAARALSGRADGPTLHELATGLDDEQVAAVVEGLYLAWYEQR